MNSRPLPRRHFLQASAAGLSGALLAAHAPSLLGQSPGTRPPATTGIRVVNPRDRVPVGLIIDDSTCMVNVNRFSMPQFDAAWGGTNKVYQRNWKDWPVEIPDSFVRKFGEWCASAGVKGKYSIVPYPACVGRLDRELPGWSRREVEESIRLVRDVMMPNWDIHPEMVTHTRVIDLKTGHPHPELSLKFMENWEWTTGRSADEIAAYMAYALGILKNIGLPCEGITTPGGFGNRALPQLAQASFQSLREVFQAEIPHYFRHVYDSGTESVAPRVEYAADLDSDHPRCVVSIVGCTGDWTGGWDNVEPAGPDRFLSADGRSGRVVEVLQRGEPAMMLAHWTGIWWLGRELGFGVFQEVVRRLHEHHRDRIRWMKLSELARYWAARELTRIMPSGGGFQFHAPFACPDFTVLVPSATPANRIRTSEAGPDLRRVDGRSLLVPGSWCPTAEGTLVCFNLPRGASRLLVS